MRKFVRELVKLRRPVTAGAVVATAIALVSPFGLDVGPHGPAVTGALVAVGGVVAWLDHAFGPQAPPRDPDRELEQ